MFNILGNWQPVFQSGCIILQSHQQHMKVPVSPYPDNFYWLFYFSHSSAYKVVSHCGFHLVWFHILNDEFCWGLFIWSLTISLIFLWKYARSDPLPIFSWIICLFIVELQEYFIYSYKVLYQIYDFLPSVGHLFIFLMLSFDTQKFLIFLNSNYLFCILLSMLLILYLRNLPQGHKD